MKRKMFLLGMVLALLIAICNAPGVEVKAYEWVQHTDADYNVVPDKYNTGCGEHVYLEKIVPGTYDGITLWKSGSTDIKVDFRKYPNVTGDIVFTNVDFSDFTFRVYGTEYLTGNVRLVFNNCKFSTFRGTYSADRSEYEFNNCSFNRCYGANMTLNRCYFGGGAYDGLVPYVNVYVNDCYFSDKCMQNTAEGSGIHTDGTQIYGAKDVLAQNIHYQNCRFELPQLLNSSATVNSCIMLQMEYSDGENISFTNCRVNGGGYSIYARAGVGCKVSDVYLDNIVVGCAARWGVYCPTDKSPYVTDEGITFGSIVNADSLYVGSTWTDNQGMHISVSNDTNEERSLLVVTDVGEFLYQIPACYRYRDLTADISFNDYPFDIDVVIGNVNWAVCYDVTFGEYRQIRYISDDNSVIEYVQWNDINDCVVEDYSEFGYVEENNDVVAVMVIAQGECGAKGYTVNWELTDDGVLTISGNGPMQGYHSQKEAPWTEKRNLITKVVVCDGVTSIGDRSFNECINLEEISIPETVKSIGGLAFRKCNKLASITFPSELTYIGKYAFNYLNLEEVIFEGDIEKLVIEANNGNVASMIFDK